MTGKYDRAVELARELEQALKSIPAELESEKEVYEELSVVVRGIARFLDTLETKGICDDLFTTVDRIRAAVNNLYDAVHDFDAELEERAWLSQ